jgi:hypothetical protein
MKRRKWRPAKDSSHADDYYRAFDALQEKGLSAEDRESWQNERRRAWAAMTPIQKKEAARLTPKLRDVGQESGPTNPPGLLSREDKENDAPHV